MKVLNAALGLVALSLVLYFLIGSATAASNINALANGSGSIIKNLQGRG